MSLILDRIEPDYIQWEKNPYMFVFNNKVYNLETMEWVNGDPNDYMNISTGYDYKSPDDQDIDTIDIITKMIFPIESEHTFFMTVLASSLYCCFQDKFIICSGKGGNGKSMLNDLLLCMLGNYGYLGTQVTITQPF